MTASPHAAGQARVYRPVRARPSAAGQRFAETLKARSRAGPRVGKPGAEHGLLRQPRPIRSSAPFSFTARCTTMTRRQFLGRIAPLHSGRRFVRRSKKRAAVMRLAGEVREPWTDSGRLTCWRHLTLEIVSSADQNSGDADWSRRTWIVRSPLRIPSRLRTARPRTLRTAGSEGNWARLL